MASARHRPFMDGKFNGVWKTLRTSPYPLGYALRWPLYFYRPSTRNHSGLGRQPSEVRLHELNDADHEGVSTLLFAGDIMVLNGDEPPRLCSNLRRLISGADLFIANLEAPLGSHAAQPDVLYSFKFHMPFDFLAAIQKQTELPFSRWVLSVANNHAGDAGPEGFSETVQLLDSLSVHYVGVESGSLHRKVSVNGITLGVTNWTHWENVPLPADAVPKPRTKIDPCESCGRSNDPEIDFTIGLPHWEYEFQHFPRRKTRQFALELLGNGMDLIVGSHPHVLQPYESLNGNYCFYSLGNFCGLGVAWPVKIITLLEVQIFRDKFSRMVSISSFKFHNFYQYHQDGLINISDINEIPEKLGHRAKARLGRILL